MPTATAANLDALGPGGTSGSKTQWTQMRSLPTALGFVALKPFAKGRDTVDWTYQGVMTASASSEGAAAAATATWPAPTRVTVALAPFVAALAATGQAIDGALEVNDPEMIADEQLIFAGDQFMMTDGTVGLGQLFTTVTNVQGVAGGTLDIDVAESSGETVLAPVGHTAHCVTIINPHGKKQLRQSYRASGASWLANSAVDEHIKEVILSDPYLRERYVTSILDGHQHVFVEPFNANLQTVSGDYIGCTFIPEFGALKQKVPAGKAALDPTQESLIPAFGGVYHPAPASAIARTNAKQRLVDGKMTKYRLATRDYQGQNVFTKDLHGEAGLVLIRAANACRLRYTAS